MEKPNKKQHTSNVCSVGFNEIAESAISDSDSEFRQTAEKCLNLTAFIAIG